ncbi:serine hydrolase domain-containing protein [Thalassoroseus pseudoceratinae]|uniref:serine hydrolase domain-containing protein n=1 Tax=Thalassoroseus pseudoceratinae TaxID=2713176 RepID=UPI00141FB784|nr:serine hydrolase domain-containing protein [Thalassoroseus pseudoceratinae]
MQLGLDAFPKTAELLQQGCGRLHFGAQVYVSRFGERLANFAIGENRPGDPLDSETAMLWLSAGKPITAAAVLLAWQRGQLDLDDTVVKFIPEFETNGKKDVTIRHLLTHTAPLRNIETGWPDADWNRVIERICQAEPESNWPSGTRGGYHPQASWFILGEILQRISGDSVEHFLTQNIFEPLGVTDIHATAGGPPEHRIGVIHERVKGGLGELAWHTGEFQKAVSPGSSLRGPAAALGRFYEGLLNPPSDWLNAQTVAAMSSIHRRGLFDETLQHRVDFGLGVIVDSNIYGADTVPYGYGAHCSPRAFGHGGSQSSIGFADPEYGLVVCVIANGRPGEPQHQRRNRAVNTAIYEDIGLAKSSN